jgi:NNP family nitrate/nitrite transporter-like MFS transporter
MHLRSFLKAGHTPSLLCAFLYFDISFMVWVLVGALANSICPDERFNLNAAERGLMLSIPLLGGSILRLVLGVMTDRIGARKTGLIGLALTLIPLLLGWLWADSFPKILIVGMMLGVAGASFAAALPLASRWYPPQYQGIAMGIAGAGNSGTAVATLFAPMIAEAIGWQAVLALALIPITLTLVVFAVFAKDSPNQPAPKSLAAYGAIFKHADTWWFCILYSVTFGGFVGFAMFLNSFFHMQYGVAKVHAGYFATACVIAGSFLRPIGGYLADRFGGVRMLLMLYTGVGATMLILAALTTLGDSTLLLYASAVVMFLGMGMLGMGNGSVFQLVPQRFPKEIGVITGIVGAAGGIGGFFLPNLLLGLHQMTGTFLGGFAIFGTIALGCVGVLLYVSAIWEGTFIGLGGVAPAIAPEPATA